MKKLLLLTLGLTLLTLVSSTLKAQPGTVEFMYAGDSSWNSNCAVPDTMSFMIYGSAIGYASNDSVLIDIYFGDGTDTSFYTPIVQLTYFYEFDITHIYTLPGNYSVTFVATGSDGATDTLIDNTVLIANSCGNVNGFVYVDANSNCVWDVGETLVPNLSVQATINGNAVAWSYTDSLGIYNINLPSGFTYELGLVTNIAATSCPVGGTYTITTLPTGNLNFGLACTTGFDYTGYITSQGFRPLTNSNLWIAPRNLLLSCTSPASTVTITLDPLLSYVSSSITPTAINGQQLTFSAGSLNAISPTGFIITVLTLNGANIGDTLCVQMTVDPVTGDINATNNNITACFPVRNSFDPNEKQEQLAGTTTANILPGIGLDYTIHFQNLGNDDAYDIFIIDTLDTDLDISSFEYISSSHDPVITFHQGNIVRFEFKNINLPAASVNEPLSHGYVRYRINVPAGLADGTTMTNNAHIYFDFNPAITTNTVTHVVDLSSGTNEISDVIISTYPNPANHEINLILDDSVPSDISLFDLSGKAVMTTSLKGNGKLNVSEIASGTYLLKVSNKFGDKNIKVVIQ